MVMMKKMISITLVKADDEKSSNQDDTKDGEKQDYVKGKGVNTLRTGAGGSF